MARNGWLVSLLAGGILGTAGAADAQVSVQVNGTDVQVQTGTSAVSVNGGRVYTDGHGTSGTTLQRSYQYQDSDGYSEWSLAGGGPGRYYLVVQAPQGQLLRGRVRLNGRTLANLNNRSSLVLPLAGWLRHGPNRLDLDLGVSGASVGLAGAAGGRSPYFRGGRLYGSQRTWLQQSGGGRYRTIVLTLDD
ncbi:hypothetical protein [Gloeobacter morelensis]|uniref:Uncharacterized protein n=1 Tax=Gloeobacter morelensis MG652769 TaxID=2781736 RepID=A0ABY3PN92_9CYAN|nr:hypothetical protein [Gloeobacter morelensis]UFP95043.1 hypothetical protein ISF26_01985 [Gloeobacter morelensis MG652769]